MTVSTFLIVRGRYRNQKKRSRALFCPSEHKSCVNADVGKREEDSAYFMFLPTKLTPTGYGGLEGQLTAIAVARRQP